jgi:uncharacterized protein YcbK (DUF882 family)
MGDLSKHFSRSEFACRCKICFKSSDATVDIGLVEMLEAVRRHFGQSVIVTSGMRCMKHNAAVNGKSTSYHLLGRAADIKVRFVKPQKVYDFLEAEYPDSAGLGSYDKFTHVDSRAKKARWTG